MFSTEQKGNKHLFGIESVKRHNVTREVADARWLRQQKLQ